MDNATVLERECFQVIRFEIFTKSIWCAAVIKRVFKMLLLKSYIFQSIAYLIAVLKLVECNAIIPIGDPETVSCYLNQKLIGSNTWFESVGIFRLFAIAFLCCSMNLKIAATESCVTCCIFFFQRNIQFAHRISKFQLIWNCEYSKFIVISTPILCVNCICSEHENCLRLWVRAIRRSGFNLCVYCCCCFFF